MELQHTTRSVGSLETVYDGKLEQSVDGDITLPEYCPDILRILKCAIEPSVHSVQAVGERVTAEGMARVTVLYAGEDGSLQSFEQGYPFSRTADIPGLGDGAAVTAAVKTEFANGRAVSQRRLDIHGMLTVNLRVRRRREDAILTGVSGGGIQTLGDQVKLSSLEALQAASFPLTEVIEVEQGAPAVDQIILRRASIIPQEVKAIKNKLLIKGAMETRVVYRSRGSRDPVQVLHTMPISQIIEAPGVSEDTENTLHLHISSLDVTPKADSNGAARLLEIAARVAADIKGYAPVELSVVKDAYSTMGGVKPEPRRLETQRLAERLRETFLAKENFDFGSKGIQSVQLLSGEVLPPEVTVHGDTLSATGQVKYHIVYLDSDGQIANADREVPFAFRRALKQCCENPTANIDIALLSTQEIVTGDSLELRAELVASGELFAADSRSIVAAIAEDEEETPPSRAPLTIYFAAQGEPLWEIAKRYRTTMEAVQRENELSADTAASGQMLLIPSV